jgi:hypothetical protein
MRDIIQQYRKKPVVIQALIWDASTAAAAAVIAWNEHTRVAPDGSLLIDTLEGTMTAELGDYVVRGVAGEIYPVKPSIFAQSYELVVDP